MRVGTSLLHLPAAQELLASLPSVHLKARFHSRLNIDAGADLDEAFWLYSALISFVFLHVLYGQSGAAPPEIALGSTAASSGVPQR